MAATVTPISSGIGVKELAEHLGTTPYNLRAFIRMEGLGGVGRGSKYSWKSLKDPKAKAIIARWEAAQGQGA